MKVENQMFSNASLKYPKSLHFNRGEQCFIDVLLLLWFWVVCLHNNLRIKVENVYLCKMVLRFGYFESALRCHGSSCEGNLSRN